MKATKGQRKARAPASNGVGRERSIFADVDGRSVSYRRFRDCELALVQDLGGYDNTSEAEKLLCRKAASLTVQTESYDARVAAGEAVDGEDYVRLTNALTRVLLALGLRRRAKDVTPGLHDYLRGLADGEDDAQSTASPDARAKSSPGGTPISPNGTGPRDGAAPASHLRPTPQPRTRKV